MSNKKSKSRSGALLLTITFACAMFGARTWTQIVLLGVAIALSLLYGLSGWVTQHGLSVAERMGRAIILSAVIIVAVGLYSWWFRPGWHLSGAQEDGLADMATHIPKGITVLIELPETSWQGQEYGREVMQVLREKGVASNSVTVFHGFDVPSGITISARYRNDPAYDVAGYVHSKMLFLKMPVRFQDGNAAADATSFFIYIGSRPQDDE